MRFCMVTTFFPPYSTGGDAIFVERLSHLLAAHGHEVEVVHCVEAHRLLDRGTAPRPRVDQPPGVMVHALTSRGRALWPLAMQQTGGPAFGARRLRALLDRDFDVLHFHNVSLIGGPDILRYGRAVKLYTMHEYWLVCPMHVLYRNGRELCERPTCFTCSLAHGRPPQLWRYTGKLAAAAEHVDAFLGLSEWSIEAHRRRGFDTRLRLLPPFVPRAVAPDPEADATAGARGSLPYYLFAGRLETIKGPQTLLSHFGGATGPELWIAGSGSLEPQLRRAAAGLTRVRLLGHVGEPRLSALFRDAIAVLVPSLSHEIFPLVILEALRQGTPVVARRRGGITEAVETSGGGLLYEHEQELDSALARFEADPALRERLGERGRAAFEERWTPEAHLRSYLGVIAEVRATAAPHR